MCSDLDGLQEWVFIILSVLGQFCSNSLPGLITSTACVAQNLFSVPQQCLESLCCSKWTSTDMWAVKIKKGSWFGKRNWVISCFASLKQICSGASSPLARHHFWFLPFIFRFMCKKFWLFTLIEVWIFFDCNWVAASSSKVEIKRVAGSGKKANMIFSSIQDSN